MAAHPTEEARARAEEMRDEHARQTLLRIAHVYDLMAKRAAERKDSSGET